MSSPGCISIQHHLVEWVRRRSAERPIRTRGACAGTRVSGGFLDSKRRLGATLVVKAGMASPRVVLKPCGAARCGLSTTREARRKYEPTIELVVTPGRLRYSTRRWTRQVGGRRRLHRERRSGEPFATREIAGRWPFDGRRLDSRRHLSFDYLSASRSSYWPRNSRPSPTKQSTWATSPSSGRSRCIAGTLFARDRDVRQDDWLRRVACSKITARALIRLDFVWASNMPDNSKPIAGWERYEPSEAAPWNRQRVVHLHRRAAFAATWDEIERDIDEWAGQGRRSVAVGKGPNVGRAAGLRFHGPDHRRCRLRVERRRAAQGLVAVPDAVLARSAARAADAPVAQPFRHEQSQGAGPRLHARAERAVPQARARARSASCSRRSSSIRRCSSGSMPTRTGPGMPTRILPAK